MQSKRNFLDLFFGGPNLRDSKNWLIGQNNSIKSATTDIRTSQLRKKAKKFAKQQASEVNQIFMHKYSDHVVPPSKIPSPRFTLAKI